MRVTVSAGTLSWCVALVMAAPALAEPVTPRDAATDALQRAAFVALPAVYNVSGGLRVEEIVTGGRHIRIDRTVPIHGTAFGVGPDRVVTALHLVRPPTARVLDDLAALGVKGLPTDPSTARVIAKPVTHVRLTSAQTAGSGFTCAGAVPTTITATVGRAATNPEDDLVLLKITAPNAPTLALNDDQHARTPVAEIGFGDQSGAIPAIRAGTIIGPARIGANDAFATVEIDVLRGDSGAPVIDEHGQSRGVILRRETDQTKPVMAQAKSVRRLLAADGVTNLESAATTGFRTAMAAFWDRDYGLAERRLTAVTQTYPNAALARCGARHAQALANARYEISGPSRTRAAIFALGAMATLAAAILGIVRVRRHPID
jgi:hypothetical protein